MAIFDIKNLTFTYSGAKSPVIDNLSLSIEQGDFCVICGKSGSGKSTLLRLLKREVAPRGDISGEILFNDMQPCKLQNEVSVSEIGFVHQDIDSQLVCDKVWKELSFGLGNLGFDDDYIAARVAEVSEYFGISKWYNRKISELSGGSKQIVSLAAVMTMNPKVLLLDEPTSMLDPIAKKNFVSILSRLNKEFGITIVMVEHNLESVFEIATQIVVLDSGKVVCKENPLTLAGELFDNPYAKYIGLTEFAEIYARFEKNKIMPLDINGKKAWLKNKLNENINYSKNLRNSGSNFSATAEKETLIKADRLCFRYDKKGEDIVKDCSFDLKKGEIVCVVGGNGGGKTTFINLLNGVLKSYSGRIKVDKNCKIATMPQNAKGLFVENSVQDELLVCAKLLKVDKAVALKLMESFDLEHISQNHPYDISGGEVQRLALAKLFLTNPDIIIFDEPTQGMDMSAKEYLKNLLVKNKNEGKGVIVVTHDLRFAASVADRVGIFFDGKILSLRDGKEFFAGNSLYTTESSLLTRDFADHLYCVEKIVDELNYDEHNK